MTPEQIQKIVDDAPDWAFGYCQSLSVYTSSAGQETKLLNITSLDSMRAELARREPMELRDVDIPHGTIVLEK